MSIFRVPQEAWAAPGVTSQCKWTWEGAELSAPGLLWGQTVALSAVSVLSLPKVIIRKCGNKMFLPQDNHDGAILNVKHKPGARKVNNLFTVYLPRPELSLLSETNTAKWRRADHSFFSLNSVSPAPPPLVFNSAFEKCSYGAPLKPGILFIWGKAAVSGLNF